MKKWSIRMQDGGPHTHYDTREQARAAAKHRSRFDDCAYCVFMRKVCSLGEGLNDSVTKQPLWEHVETHDFHRALRKAVT